MQLHASGDIEEGDEEIGDVGEAITNIAPDLRTIGLCGEIDEEKVAELVAAFLLLRNSGITQGLDTAINDPIEFVISTTGGSAHDMFTMYDIMRLAREDCEITTVGLGKVMSAGVLLLAAGTKGSRKIGKNCRVMIHAVLGGHVGTLHNLENEMDEIRWMQEQYISALASETDMTKRFWKKLIDKKVNIYLTAEEAVQYGIADEVV
jgi:ATP-dependent Clp protease protease subunit